MSVLLVFAFSSIYTAEAQNMIVKGKILDSDGNPVEGVTVLVKGTNVGVMSNELGDYQIQNVPKDGTLEFSFVGYVTVEKAVTGTTINVVMIESSESLEEITLVAFGKQKKESVVASITTVKPSELRVPSSNLTTAFAGRVAGLISYQVSGEPGQDNAQFFIRGITSFGASAKKDPLILIDGVELSSEELARLNPDDIATFSVLKDAAAAALYGARGANGVLAVTTREGKEGITIFNARIENTFSMPTQMVKTANPVTFMRMHNEAIKTRDPLGLALYSEEKITMTERGMHPVFYPATDWHDAMFEDVISNQRANISVSGGGAVARYYVAANISKDNGNIKVDKRNDFNSNINLIKYNLRSNVNINLTKTTELITRLNASFDEYTGPLDGGESMYRKVIQANPVLFKPYYEPDEQFAYLKDRNSILFGNYGGAFYLNPYAESLKGYRDYSKNLMLTQMEIKQNLNMITEGLSVRAMVNMDRASEYEVHREYFPLFYNVSSYDRLTGEYRLVRLNPENYGVDQSLKYNPYSRQVNTTFYLETAAEYNRTFAEKHSAGALMVYTMRQRKEGISDNLQLSLPSRNIGLSGRFTYSYDSRYFLEFDFGYNGSERFSIQKRFGFFPAIAGGWMLSNEPFFEPLRKVFTTFKLKGTYGLVGSDQIGDARDRFYYLSDVVMNYNKSVNWGTQMNYNPGSVSINRYANADIGWETSYKSNVGMELVTAGGLSINAEYFQERRENILIDRIIPSTMGIIPDVKANLGVGQNKGFDVELNYEKSINKDLWFIGRGTFTFTRTKVLEWEEPDFSETPWRSRVGLPISQRFGFIAERLFIDDAEVKNSPAQFGIYQAGDIKYRDINGDGRISALDQVPIGYPTEPEINYGFGLSAGYKGFDFSFFFAGQGRKSFWLEMNDNGLVQPFLDGQNDDNWFGQNAVLQAIADNYWSESNRNPYAFWPRLANYWVENNSQTSTWFMQDASFLRLKSAEIGYTLPLHLAKKLYLAKLRVYVSGTNLYCWSGFKLWDPEMGGKGLGYPVQRTVNIGLNIGL
ncbi:MAG: TonB-dependent receptor [Prevotellaceae bacterium]|nr:TonB-dependent receptor [Prevotellaceae bacterium]